MRAHPDKGKMKVKIFSMLRADGSALRTSMPRLRQPAIATKPPFSKSWICHWDIMISAGYTKYLIVNFTSGRGPVAMLHGMCPYTDSDCTCMQLSPTNAHIGDVIIVSWLVVEASSISTKVRFSYKSFSSQWWWQWYICSWNLNVAISILKHCNVVPYQKCHFPETSSLKQYNLDLHILHKVS